jgi:hypothetical protein
VKIATPDAVSELTGLPLEATFAMADVAAAMREVCWRWRRRQELLRDARLRRCHRPDDQPRRCHTFRTSIEERCRVVMNDALGSPTRWCLWLQLADR